MPQGPGGFIRVSANFCYPFVIAPSVFSSEKRSVWSFDWRWRVYTAYPILLSVDTFLRSLLSFLLRFLSCIVLSGLHIPRRDVGCHKLSAILIVRSKASDSGCRSCKCDTPWLPLCVSGGCCIVCLNLSQSIISILYLLYVVKDFAWVFQL